VWACSYVAVTKRLLQDALAMAGQDILHPIRVSLKKKESLLECLWLLSDSLITPCFCFCFCTAWPKTPGPLLIRVRNWRTRSVVFSPETEGFNKLHLLPAGRLLQPLGSPSAAIKGSPVPAALSHASISAPNTPPHYPERTLDDNRSSSTAIRCRQAKEATPTPVFSTGELHNNLLFLIV
jgi:hypothetical protein